MSNLNEEPPAVVVGVPGFWPSIDVLQKQLELNGRGWRLTGDALEGPNGARFSADIYEPDPALRRAFAAAGKGRIPQGTIDSIKDHTYCVYVVSTKRGRDTVGQLIDVSAALLEAGGVAVKIESTGLAHSADTWLALANSPLKLLYMLNHFVVYVGEKGTFCSCGMHSFALPDASVARDADAQNLLTTFNGYQFHERPTLRDGDTFNGAGASVYRLFHKAYELYPPSRPFYNPYGRWDLQRVRRLWWRAG